MEKLPYYNRQGDFNGCTTDFDVARAVHYSKTITPPQVVRIPVDSGFRYFMRGFEVQRDEVFLAGTEQKPKRKPKPKERIKIADRVFTWKGHTWMKSKAKATHNCHLTASKIHPGSTMYRTDVQGVMISRARLSIIPDDAVKI